MRLVSIAFLLVACGHHDNPSSAVDAGADDGDGRSDTLGDGGDDDADGGSDVVTPVGGVLDPDFGNGGVVVVSSAGAEHAYDLAVQPDGKIVVVGDAPGGMLLLRFTDNGALDPSFGTQGRVVVGDAYATAKGVALQPDGKIVVAGENQAGATALARLDSAGALDPAFGAGGIATPIQNANGIGIANDVAVLPDGRIVFCGEGIPETGTINLGIVGRVTAAGALDTTFGTGGYSTLTANHGGGFARLARDGHGRIVAVGTVYYNYPSGNGHSWLLGRFDGDGVLDPGFFNGARTIGSEDSYAFDLAVDAHGEPLAMGLTASFSGNDGPKDMAHRTLLDGTEDPTFGTFGTQTWRTSSLASVEGYAMALQNDGASVMVGEGTRFGTSTTLVVDVSRLTTTGARDSTFATDGVLVFEVSGGDAHPRGAASARTAAHTGAIYIAGFVTSGSANHVFLARVH